MVEKILGDLPEVLNEEVVATLDACVAHVLDAGGFFTGAAVVAVSEPIEDFELISHGDSYIYSFEFLYETNMENVTIAAQNGSIINFNYNQQTGIVNGLINLSENWVNNFCADTISPVLCFDITGCISDMFCTATVCVDQSYICDHQKILIFENPALVDDNLPENFVNKIYLTPNPASNIIYLTGTDIRNIKQITCIDLNGKILKQLSNNNELNVSNLTPGIYIIRVDTADGNVDYLRFVKQ